MLAVESVVWYKVMQTALTPREKRKIEVVLVTGSSGFLGQHVVKLLQEHDKTVKEIRLFDIKPYENNLSELGSCL